MSRWLLMLLAAGVAGSAYGQTIEWSNGAGGDWSSPANWSPQNVPDGGGEHASIALGGLYTVTLGASPTIGKLAIANPDATLSILGGFMLTTTNAAMLNRGHILINGDKATGDAQLRTTVQTLLTGDGEIVLLLGSKDLNDAALATSNATLTQGADHRIRGAGTISASLVSFGTVRADAPGEVLVLSTNPKTNSGGTMEAVGGGTLRIQGVTVTQQGGGKLRAGGGRVELSGGGVAGGLLITEPGPPVECTFGTSTLTGVVNEGDLFVQDGAFCVLKDSFENHGVVTVNPDPGMGNATLRADTSLTLTGDGEVLLRLGSNDLSDATLATGDGAILTQSPTHMIHGAGTISARFVNNGKVLADDPGEILQFNASLTNNSEISAKDGGILRIIGILVTQGGEGVVSADDGVVRLSEARITGGKLASSGAGFVEATYGSQIFTDLENAATLNVPSSSNILVKGSGIVNDGAITLNSNAGTGNSIMRFEKPGSLLGSGSVVMKLGSSDLNDAQFATLNSQVTQGKDHTIRGAGNLTADLVNLGAVVADSPGKVLQLTGVSKVNKGLIAAAGGILRIKATTINQSGDGIIRAEAGLVELHTDEIVAGAIAQAGGGSLRTASGLTVLTDVTMAEGRLEIDDYTEVEVRGAGMTNNGDIVINPDGGVNDAVFRLDSLTALEGEGTVTMRLGSTDLDDAQLVVVNSDTDQTATIGPGQTVRGSGNIRAGDPVAFLGTLSPGEPGKPIGKFGGSGLLKLGPSSLFDIQVGGTGDGQFDMIGGRLRLALDGTLKVSLVNGFEPELGDRFAVIKLDEVPVTEEFDAVTGIPGPGMVWKAIYGTFSVEIIASCYADAQPDGALDLFDFLAFVNLFNAGSPDADCVQDGGLDLFDFLCFVNLFNQGC